MAHFGILCLTFTGHLNPMTALGSELQRRGHRVTVFGLLDAQAKVTSARLDFKALGEDKFPLGSFEILLDRLGKLRGADAMQHTTYLCKLEAIIKLREAPTAIEEAGVEFLLIDQSALEGGTIAEHLNIPFITICNALMLNVEPKIPPIFFLWKYDSSCFGELRNLIGHILVLILLGITGLSLRILIDNYRKDWELAPYPYFSKIDVAFSPLAQISQQPLEFEFERRELPEYFHFTGPFLSLVNYNTTPFPRERLTGQRLVYASLGTVQNSLKWVFQVIAESCVGLDVQLVITTGGSDVLDSLLDLPGSPLVVEYAPQLALLQIADLTITHAGMNTVLESLTYGVPMVGIPITNDQPGVAARIAWTGTGEVVHLSDLSVDKLRAAIQRVLTENTYRTNALRLQKAIERAGGVKRAAEIIEQVIHTGKPATSQNFPA